MDFIYFRHYISTILKFLFLIIAILIIVFLYLKSKNTHLAKNQNKYAIHQIINSSPNYEITLDNPIFKGINSGTSYIINAQKAIKYNNDLYKLENLNSTYFIHNIPCNIVSNEGTYHKDKNIIYLSGDIKAILQDCIMTTNLLEINLKTNETIGRSKTKINFKDSEITADKFQTNNDNAIRFEGNVKTKFNIKK